MARTEARSFNYQRRTREDVKERANMRGGGFDSYIKPKYKMYKVRDGKNLIRVLPPTWPKAKHYGYDIWVNYGIGVDNQSYLSLSKMKQEKDPLLEGRRQAERDGDEKLARALQPRQRILMWVIDRLDEDEGPQLWPAPFSFDRALANISTDEDSKEVVFIDDPKEGRDVRFYKEGSGLKTKYDASRMKLMQAAPLSDDSAMSEEWLDYITQNPVPDCLQFYDYEHIAGVFDGNARVDNDDDEDEKPRKTRRDDDDDPPPKRRPSARDDDDDDPPFDGGKKVARKPADDDDDDPPPKRARTRVNGTDDDDDDPKPKRAAVSDDDDDPPPRESIRDRLKKRHSAQIQDDDD